MTGKALNDNQNDEEDKIHSANSSDIVNDMIKELLEEADEDDVLSSKAENKPKAQKNISESLEIKKKNMTRKRKTKSEKNKKKNNNKLVVFLKYTGIVLGSIIAILIIIYFGIGYIYYHNRFLDGTVINGYDCSNMKVEDAFDVIDKHVTSFKLDIYQENNLLDTITGDDIGINTGSTDEEMSKICKEQKKYLWFEAFHKKSAPLTTSNMIQYDQDKFNSCLENLKSMNTKPTVVSQNARLDTSGDRYKIIPEIYGNEIDKSLLKNLITKNIQSLGNKIDVADDDCYIKPTLTKDDTKLINARDTANKILNSTLSVKIINKKENIDFKTLKSWVSVDDEYNVSPNEDNISAYVNTLNNKYTTYGKDRKFKTTYGDTVTVVGGDYGRRLNASALKSDLINAVKAGQSSTISAKFSRTAMGSLENDLGTTYAEIDLTNQRMWMYKDGKVVVSTDIVTGKADGKHETPQGTYKLKYKQKDATLNGENYSTPVAWWMPFNGDIGMHDATWQPTFGGDRYKLHGSHGCINLPLDKAASIFNYSVVNMPVICYYHTVAENPSSVSSSETTTQTTTKAG